MKLKEFSGSNLKDLVKISRPIMSFMVSEPPIHFIAETAPLRLGKPQFRDWPELRYWVFGGDRRRQNSMWKQCI
jgi:hypothetical protein